MAFAQTWAAIQQQLPPGTQIQNWTRDKGYLGDSFDIHAVQAAQIEIASANADNIQRVPAGDFVGVYALWQRYLAGRVRRSDIRDNTRYSKYIISIFHWLQGISPGNQLP